MIGHGQIDLLDIEESGHMARKPAAAAKKSKRKPAKSKYEFLQVRRRKGACIIQLNRPEKLNARC